MGNLPTLDDAIRELEKLSVHTSQGAYVKVEDVRKLMQERQAAAQIEHKESPQPKDMNQAKRMAMKDENLIKQFPKPPPRLGKSISANEPQSSSRT